MPSAARFVDAFGTAGAHQTIRLLKTPSNSCSAFQGWDSAAWTSHETISMIRGLTGGEGSAYGDVRRDAFVGR